MSQLHTDEPIQGTSKSPDLLHRKKFASNVAEALISVPSSSGFVISLEGPWGYGKTSILNLITRYYEELPKDKRPITCAFNPWLIGNADTLVQSFLVQLAAAIDFVDHAKNGVKAAKELLSYSSVFAALKFVPGAEPWASIVKTLIDAVGGASKSISELHQLDVEQKRAAVVKALGNLKKRIVVFIDDLDRLPPPEIFSMIRAVKAVGDFPGVTYVLCFESSYVQETLRGYGIQGAEEYLDKVVQTRLTLPLIAKDDLITILDAEMNSLPEDAKKDHFRKTSERYSDLFFSGLRNLLETPRDIKRVFNRLRFVEPGCRGEVNLADLIALETVALKAPSVYQHIRDCGIAYVGTAPGTIALKKPRETVKEFENDRKKAMEQVPDRLKKSVKELVEELFPLLNDDSFDLPTSIAKARGFVSCADRLAVALSAGIPTGEVSYAAAVNFLETPEVRAEMITSMCDAGQIRRFIEHLRVAQKETKVKDPFDAALVIGKVLDTPVGLAAEESPKNFLASGLSRNCWYLVRAMFENLSTKKREMALLNIALNPQLLSLGVHVIYELHTQNGAYPNEAAMPDEKCWVVKAKLKKLSAEWAQMIVQQVLSKGILSTSQIGLIFGIMKDFHPDVLATILTNVVDSDDLFDHFVMSIGERGSSSEGRYCKFYDRHFDGFGGAEKFKARAAERLRDPNIVGELKTVLTAIKTGKKKFFGGQGEDD